MFGYVTIDKPELKFREFDNYRAHYCGLCRELRERYGIPGQLTLTYDLTFVILLLEGLYEPKTLTGKTRCAVHPLIKQPVCKSRITEYAADMNILMTYYKCEDDWMDEHKLRKKIFANLLKKKVHDVEEKYPQKALIIKDLLEEIHIAEAKKASAIDEVSGMFGQIMAEILALKNDEWEDELREIGFYLGKFVYLMDAYEDIEKDIKDGNYNPFADIYKDDNFEERVYDILTMMMADCSRGFERLPVIDNIEILRNILYAGVWTRYEMVKSRKEGNNNDGSL